MLDGAFASIYGDAPSLLALLLSCGVSLLLGVLIAWSYRKTAGSGGTMGGALAMLPFLVQIVILLVNGNLGAGVAVAGAFSLVRFRSVPGTARDITAIFLAMTVGLACGMGYLLLSALTAAVVCAGMLAAAHLAPGAAENGRELKITIPETLDYAGLFDDLMAQYTRRWQLFGVKTANLGSLYCLHYHIELKDPKREKEFLDHLRRRNGNLDVSCGRTPSSRETL